MQIQVETDGPAGGAGGGAPGAPTAELAAALRRRSEANLLHQADTLELGRNVCWRLSTALEAVGQALFLLATVLAFAASYWDRGGAIAFAAGMCGAAGLGVTRYAAYAGRESSERALVLNRIRQYFGLAPLPELYVEPKTAAPAAEAEA